MSASLDLSRVAIYKPSDQCWLGLIFPEDAYDNLLAEKLRQHGLKKINDTGRHCYVLPVTGKWKEQWGDVQALIASRGDKEVRMAILQSQQPTVDEIAAQAQPLQQMQAIASSLWLLEALEKNPVEPFFQPVMNERKQAIGYEALVRIRESSGELASGQRIIDASNALNIQHIVDRYLHAVSVEGFAEAKLGGKLIVNMIPGFIRKPSYYLEALSTAALNNGMRPGDIVLDISRSGEVTHLSHLHAIVEYCHTRGFEVALDNLLSLNAVLSLAENLKPDYVKFDRALTSILVDPDNKAGREELEETVEQLKQLGCEIVAQGVEDAEAFQMLKKHGVALFQGYYFARPAPASAFKKS